MLLLTPIGLGQSMAPTKTPRGLPRGGAVSDRKGGLEAGQDRAVAKGGALAVLFLQAADAEVPARADGPRIDVEIVVPLIRQEGADRSVGEAVFAVDVPEVQAAA